LRFAPTSAARRAGSDFRTLAKHVLGVLLHMPANDMIVDAVSAHLRSALKIPLLEINQAVYCCRLPQQHWHRSRAPQRSSSLAEHLACAAARKKARAWVIRSQPSATSSWD